MRLLIPFNRLKVQSKLTLVFAVPFCSVLLFTLLGANQHYQEMIRNQRHWEFVVVSSSLIDLVLALQDERSAGVIPEANRVSHTRSTTESTIEALSYLLPGKHEYFGLEQEFEDLVALLHFLPEVRGAVDGGAVATRYYSKLIANTLNIIGYLVVDAEDAELVRLVDGVITLLQLEEQARLERDSIYRISKRGEIDADTFREISAYTANQTPLLNRYYAIANRSDGNLMRDRMSLPMIKKIELMRNQLINRAIRRGTIADLLESLLALQDYKHSLYASGTGSGTGASDMLLSSSRALIEKLQDSADPVQLQKITEYFASDGSNPEPSRQSIVMLFNALSGDVADYWLTMGLHRIRVFSEIRSAGEKAVHARITDNLRATRSAVVWYLGGSLVTLSVSVLLGLLLGRRLVTGMQEISSALGQMRESDNLAPSLNTAGDDELSEMAQAFNHLITARLASEERQQLLQDELLQMQKNQNVELERRVTLRTRELNEARLEAEVASRAKSLFLGNVSHHIRTPLNAILGYAQLLGRSVGLAPEHQQQVGVIYENGQQLLAIMDDVLEMAKLEKGESVVDSTCFEIRGLLNSLCFRAKQNAEAKALQFNIEIDETLPEMVTADRGKLAKVIDCLLDNAIKFTENGTVILRAGYADAALFFEIEDTGVGMDADQLAGLCEAFEQARPGCEQSGGIGIGLSLANQLLMLMQGKLCIDSKAGQGSLVVITVPVIEQPVDRPLLQSVSPERVSRLSPPLLSRFRRVIQSADFISISAVIDEVAEEDVDIAEAFSGLLNQYDLETMNNLVNQA